jgi:carboxyl-terminal processing protease
MTTFVALLAAAVSACNCSSSATVQGAAAAEPQSATQAAAADPAEAPASEGPGIELPPVPPADPREPLIAAAVGRLLESQHLAGREIDDQVSRKAFDYWMERLDPAKLFLLKPQVEYLRQRAADLDDELVSGDLKLARQGTAILAQQRQNVAKMVAELTSAPFDLSDDEHFEADVDKRDFAPDDAALRDLWRRNLERQVLERVARMERALSARAELEKEQAEGSAKQGATRTDDAEEAAELSEEDIPDTEAGREKKAREELAAAYAGRFERRKTPEPLEAAETFLNAFGAVFDPHTMYLAPDDKANFDIQMTGSLEGIGAVLSEGDHYIEVREVVPGGAAWRQGELEAGDLIVSVTQDEAEPVDVADMRLAEVVNMIRGPKGTVVSLSVRKPDGRLASIVITRDVVVVEATYARGALLEEAGKGGKKVGYIYLPSFYGNTRGRGGSTPQRTATGDVRALLKRFTRQNVKSVVLDLRGNGGGLLSEATGVAGLFIKKGPVVQVRRSDGDTQVLRDKDPTIAYEGDVLVLVDRFSASASEIVAGALQDYGRAMVVGTGPTHGKGTVQMLADLDRLMPHRGKSLGVLKFTTQQFFLVDGESTQQRGVEPDVLLPDPASYVESGERYLDNPIPWSKVDPLPHQQWKGGAWNLEKVVARSKARVSKSDEFTRIQARSKYLEARRDDTRIPLQQSAWKAREEAQDEALEAYERDDEDQPAMLTVQPVSYRESQAAASGDDEARKAAQERIEKWRKQLERDPWVAESLHIVRDMISPG